MAKYSLIYRCLAIVIWTIVLIIPSNCAAQIIRSRDGVNLGTRDEFVTSCVSASNSRLLTISGLEVRTTEYCECVCDALLPSLTSSEIQQAMQYGSLMELFTRPDKLDMIMRCLDDNFSISKNYVFGNSETTNFEKSIAIKQCVREVYAQSESKNNLDPDYVNEYCSCAINRLYAEGYTFGDLDDIDSENSIAYNEIVIYCLDFAEKLDSDRSHQASVGAMDISGGGPLSIVPLIDYLGNGYKVKITVSGVPKYFLLDTGASDIVIDEETEKEIREHSPPGTLKYVGRKEYQLADNRSVEGRVYRVNHVNIGEYRLSNVLIAVVDDSSLLCGRSFLDKFSSWRIDKSSGKLIVYK